VHAHACSEVVLTRLWPEGRHFVSLLFDDTYLDFRLVQGVAIYSGVLSLKLHPFSQDHRLSPFLYLLMQY